MVKKITAIYLVVALLIASNGQIVLLQTVAWAKMLAAYSKDAPSLSQALSNTFDGSKPCNICLVVQKTLESEKNTPDQYSTIEIAPLKLALVDSFSLISPVRHSRTLLELINLSKRIFFLPLTPPPQTV